MKAPGIGIAVTPASCLSETGALVELPFHDVSISGNKLGLLELAKLIQRVADSDQEGFHVHINPDDDVPLLRTREFTLIIEKNSLK